MTEPLTAAGFTALIDVSRETLDQLQTYLDLLQRWQRAINLVGPKTLADPWRRHILDCAQLMPAMPPVAGLTFDLGSGAGLPGLILAILGQPHVHLVESDQRKAQFLREAARILGLDVTIHAMRIDALQPVRADIVTARALAPLPRLLDLATSVLGPATICLFLKGRTGQDELTEASKSWMMSSQSLPSLSDPSASVLKIWGIKRASLHRQ